MSHLAVSDDDRIIRRILPSGDIETTIVRPDGSHTPTSATLGLRHGELGLSCSLRRITSPQELLRQIGASVDDGWTVAEWRVGDLPADLEVVVTPSVPPDLDPGHCEIRPRAGKTFSKRLQSKLAKQGRVLDPSEFERASTDDT